MPGAPSSIISMLVITASKLLKAAGTEGISPTIKSPKTANKSGLSHKIETSKSASVAGTDGSISGKLGISGSLPKSFVISKISNVSSPSGPTIGIGKLIFARPKSGIP